MIKTIALALALTATLGACRVPSDEQRLFKDCLYTASGQASDALSGEAIDACARAARNMS